ncbi:MAG: 50S ribosomal protein L10 [Buchnera aphidicola (Kaburagia rhusicola ensigallis)]
MVLNFPKKKEIVSKIHNITKKALSIVIADSRNIKVNNITELRVLARKVGVTLGVFKNTLVNLGIKNTQFECLKELLIGPVLIGYSIDHPRSAARLFREFSINNTNFKILGAVFKGKILPSCNIGELADIPTYKEVISRLMIVMKTTAIGKLIQILVSIKQLKNKK